MQNCLFGRAQDLPARFVERPARLRHADPARGAYEQGCPDLGLKTLHVRADHGLRDPKTVGGGRQRTRLDYRRKNH